MASNIQSVREERNVKVCRSILLHESICRLGETVSIFNKFLLELKGADVPESLDPPICSSQPCFFDIYSNAPDLIHSKCDSIDSLLDQLRDMLI